MFKILMGLMIMVIVLIGVVNMDYARALVWDAGEKIKNEGSVDTDIKEMKLHEKEMKEGVLDIRVAILQSGRQLLKLKKEKVRTNNQLISIKSYISQNLFLLENEDGRKSKKLSIGDVKIRLKELDVTYTSIKTNLVQIDSDIKNVNKYIKKMKQNRAKSSIIIVKKENTRKMIERQNVRLKSLRKICEAINKISSADSSGFDTAAERAQNKLDGGLIRYQQVFDDADNSNKDMNKRDYEVNPFEKNLVERMKDIVAK